MLTKIWDFFFHRHQWEIIQESEIILNSRVRGTFYVQKCVHCGAIKSKKVEL